MEQKYVVPGAVAEEANNLKISQLQLAYGTQKRHSKPYNNNIVCNAIKQENSNRLETYPCSCSKPENNGQETCFNEDFKRTVGETKNKKRLKKSRRNTKASKIGNQKKKSIRIAASERRVIKCTRCTCGKRGQAKLKPGVFDTLFDNVGSIQMIHYLQSGKNLALKAVVALLLVTAAIATSYNLYKNLIYYIQNPVYVQRMYNQQENSPFPDLEICSTVQVRWSKLQEMEPFKTLEYVPNLITFNRNTRGGFIRRKCPEDEYVSLDSTDKIGPCQAKMDFIMSAVEYEKNVAGSFLPRFSRNLFRSNGSFNLNLLPHFPVSFEQYRQKLEHFSANIRTSNPNQKIMQQKLEYILQNRSMIVQHFLSDRFNYERFRLAVSGDPTEVVLSCMVNGNVCDQLKITKTGNNGQVCFRVQGSSIGTKNSWHSSKFSFLLDTHGLDVTEKLQDVSLKIAFLSPDRKFTSEVKKVKLLPSTYTKLTLAEDVTQRADCGSVKLLLHNAYTQVKCQMEQKVKAIYNKCACIPALSFTKEADFEKVVVCRTAEQVFCSQQAEWQVAAPDTSICPADCTKQQFMVMQIATEPLKANKLDTFPNHLKWIPTELKAFPKHFNSHNPILQKLHRLPRRSQLELPSRFFPYKLTCSDDPATLAAKINLSLPIWQWQTNTVRMQRVVMREMERQRTQLIVDLFDASVAKKLGVRLAGPSWSRTTAKLLIDGYIEKLHTNYGVLSQCMLRELDRFRYRIRDLQTAWYDRYRDAEHSLQQLQPGMQYNLHNLVRLDVQVGDGILTVETAHTVWTFLSVVGGTLTLYLGATLITLFEIMAVLWEHYTNS